MQVHRKEFVTTFQLCANIGHGDSEWSVWLCHLCHLWGSSHKWSLHTVPTCVTSDFEFLILWTDITC